MNLGIIQGWQLAIRVRVVSHICMLGTFSVLYKYSINSEK